MKNLVVSLAMCLVIAWQSVASAQTLVSATEASTRNLFDVQVIGVELKLQGEYVGKDGEKSVVARGEKSFHALVLEGGLPGDGWDGGRYGLMESGPLSQGRTEFGSLTDEGVSAVLDENGLMLKRGERHTLLKRVERKSPTLGQQPPAGAIVLFGGGDSQHGRVRGTQGHRRLNRADDV
jgi:hypothetical protein